MLFIVTFFGSICKAFSTNIPPLQKNRQPSHPWSICMRGITIMLSLPASWPGNCKRMTTGWPTLRLIFLWLVQHLPAGHEPDFFLTASAGMIDAWRPLMERVSWCQAALSIQNFPLETHSGHTCHRTHLLLEVPYRLTVEIRRYVVVLIIFGKL